MTNQPDYQPPFPVSPQPQQTPDRPWYKKKRFVIPIGVVLLFVVIGALSPDPEPKATVADSPAATEPAAKAPKKAKLADVEPTTIAPKPVAPKLTQEDRFVALVEKARDAADDADNDFQKRLPLTKRDKAFCKLLDSRRVKNWTGEVETLDTNGDGLGVLAIRIADDVKVGTWNNALSDFEDNTLIKTDSSVFDAMSGLSEGDQVTFSGTFTHDSKKCIGEQSLTDEGATQTPTFTMKFSKLTKN